MKTIRTKEKVMKVLHRVGDEKKHSTLRRSDSLMKKLTPKNGEALTRMRERENRKLQVRNSVNR